MVLSFLQVLSHTKLVRPFILIVSRNHTSSTDFYILFLHFLQKFNIFKDTFTCFFQI